MMIGEFETDNILYSVPSILLFPLMTYGLWIIFVLVMSILMQNLLVIEYGMLCLGWHRYTYNLTPPSMVEWIQRGFHGK